MTKPARQRAAKGSAARRGGGSAAGEGGAARRAGDAERAGGARSERVVLALVGAAIALFVLHAYQFRFTQDDAYISMRYARNLVEGHGLVFNLGERVEGYTNFRWTLLLALFLRLGLPIQSAAAVAGTAFACGAIAAAARLARAIEGRWGPAAAATAALLAANSALALWSTGGLETGMFTFFVTAAFERGLAPGVSARGRLLAPVFFVLASLTRPEGPFFFALWFAIRLGDTFLRIGGEPLAGPARAGSARELVRDAVWFAVPLALYAAWKLSYFGDLLPNTFYAKAGFTVEYLKRGAAYAKEFFLDYGAFGIAPALALYAARKGGLRGIEARLLAVWIGVAASIVWIGGDVLYSHRFWLPILPIGCVLVARGAARLAPHPPHAALAAIVLVLAGAGIASSWGPIQERRTLERGFVTNMTQTGQWLGEKLPPGSTIAITTIGAISYFSGLNVIDLLGLTDREIARNPKRIEGLDDTWREIDYNAESVIRRRPDAIIFSTGIRPSSAAEKALFLYRDFHDVYTPYHFRATPSRAGVQTLFHPRPGAPPPDVSLVPVTNYEFIDEYGRGHLAQSLSRDLKKAAEHFEKSWVLSNGTFRLAREWWAAALYDLKDPRGLPLIHEVAAADSGSLVAGIRLADDALRRGDLETARRWFERVRAADPDDSQGWAGLSEVARLSGDFDGARELARETVRRWDSNPSHLVMWGSLEGQAGEWETAKTLFLRALSIDANFTAARRGLYLLEEIRAGGVPAPPESSSP